LVVSAFSFGSINETVLFCSGDEAAIRTLLFDVMYCRDPRSHLLSLVILQAWPQVFSRPGFEAGHRKPDPLVDAVFWAIHNTGKATDMVVLNVSFLTFRLIRDATFASNRGKICVRWVLI